MMPKVKQSFSSTEPSDPHNVPHSNLISQPYSFEPHVSSWFDTDVGLLVSHKHILSIRDLYLSSLISRLISPSLFFFSELRVFLYSPIPTLLSSSSPT